MEVPRGAFGGRQAQRLLRLLALRRGSLLPKDVIAEALWPQGPPAHAGADIEVLVSRIRRALADRTLVQTGPGGYCMAGDDRCLVDVEAFSTAVGSGRSLLATQPAGALTHFREALRLWRGEPLPEDTYAAWAQDDRRLLDMAYTEALEGAAAAALATGDPADAVSYAEQALAREPLRETPAVLLVQARAACGDQAGALAAFDAFRDRLAAETGLDPSPAAQAVRQRVLLGQPPAPQQPEPGGAPAARLGAMPSGQRQLVCLLLVLGRPASAGFLADASGADLHEVLSDLVALGGAGVTRPGPDGWALRDEVPGSTITPALSPDQQAHAHGLLAAALQRAGAEPAEVAVHLLGAGNRDGAAAAYAAAARHRLERLEDAEAMRLAEAGLAVAPAGPARALLLRARAEVDRRHGRLAAARAGLAAALDSLDDAVGRSRVLAKLGVLEVRSASLDRGQQLIELAIAEAGDDPRALGQALAAGAILDLPAGNLVRAQHRFRRAGRLLERAGDRQAAARRLYWRAMSSYFNGRLREAVTEFGDLARLPGVAAELLRFWNPQATCGYVLALLGEAEAGLAEIGQVLEHARSSGYLVLESECLYRRACALAFAGQAGPGIESAQQAAVIAACIGHASCLASALRALGIAWETAGDLSRAEGAFRRSLRAGAGNPFLAAGASARLGACLARQGRPEDAAAHVRAALTGGTPLTRYEARWAHAELLAARGEERACREAAAAALAAARHGGYLILVPRLRQLAASPPAPPGPATPDQRCGKSATPQYPVAFTPSPAG